MAVEEGLLKWWGRRVRNCSATNNGFTCSGHGACDWPRPHKSSSNDGLSRESERNGLLGSTFSTLASQSLCRKRKGLVMLQLSPWQNVTVTNESCTLPYSFFVGRNFLGSEFSKFIY